MRKSFSLVSGNRQLGLWRRAEVNRRGRWTRDRHFVQLLLHDELVQDVADDYEDYYWNWDRYYDWDYSYEPYEPSEPCQCDYCQGTLTGLGSRTNDTVEGNDQLALVQVHSDNGVLQVASVLPVEERP